MLELIPLEDHETKRLNTHFSQIYKKRIPIRYIAIGFGSVSWASFQIFQLICLIFTGLLALQGKIQPGDVVMYQTYFYNCRQLSFGDHHPRSNDPQREWNQLVLSGKSWVLVK